MAGKTIAALCLLLFSNLCSASIPWPVEPKSRTYHNFPRKMPPANPFCPRDTVKLGVCWSLLGKTERLVIGHPLGSKCCALLEGLTDVEAAACLCTTLKENLLGVNIKWSVALSLLVSPCKKEIPDGFKCV
ncbi:14 kDa proline-rich protein DC2.15 [Cocos nucifera]|uniref:14 kDa proline-rich protein DC2.15 n=1 Tax=Cocos nucifera TaxID=13894 RepID=A0A8K0HXC6_COCNU|nr:14 kDa proline-rich protein DC2.15 [Cocos nucifera]